MIEETGAGPAGGKREGGGGGEKERRREKEDKGVGRRKWIVEEWV